MSKCKKLVLITGCDSGLGQYFARQLLLDGYFVLATFINIVNSETILQQIESESKSTGNLRKRFRPLELNLKQRNSIKCLAERVESLLERDSLLVFHALINNAGVCVMGEFHWLTPNQIDDQISVNVLGTIHLTRALLSQLIAHRGHIIVIGSVNGLCAYPGLSVYSASKFALEGFTASLRVELARFDVRVTLFRPGDIAKLTAIMGSHTRSAADQWTEMPLETRSFYGNYFSAYHETVLSKFGLSSPTRWKDTRLWLDLKRVLASDRGGALISASLMFRMVFTLLTWLPRVLRELLLAHVVRHMLPKDAALHNNTKF